MKKTSTQQQQGSLDSFFGIKSTTKPSGNNSNNKQQKKIDSFFFGTTSSSSTKPPRNTSTTTTKVDDDDAITAIVSSSSSSSSSSHITTNAVSPENILTTTTTTTTTLPLSCDDNNHHLHSDDDDDDDDIHNNQQNNTITSSVTKREQQVQPHNRKTKKKRRVIIDDDSDDDIDNDNTVPLTSTITSSSTANRMETTKDIDAKPSSSSSSSSNVTAAVTRTTTDKEISVPTIGAEKSSNDESSNRTTNNITRQNNNNNNDTNNTNKNVEEQSSMKMSTGMKKNLTSKHTSTSTSTTTTTISTSTTTTNASSSYKSNNDILQEIKTMLQPYIPTITTDTTTTVPPNSTSSPIPPIPFAIICHTFDLIEQNSSRLYIQDILTTLLRQVIVLHHDHIQQEQEQSSHSTSNHPKTKIQDTVLYQDLQAILYLSSNTVAPAYDCVELGIGDALLMKAIGQVTGTNPNMIKQQYEIHGDLGTVAQSYKRKQSTLGGYFTKTNDSKKKQQQSSSSSYLSAQEVLSYYQLIAQMKGNHSQQHKVDMIKKMLVKCTDTYETKYIIRGLQGKLRIGLAQSTVLIAFAHALVLSSPISLSTTTTSIHHHHHHHNTNNNTVNDDSNMNDQIIPVEAKQYQDTSIPIEKKLELATIIVKKAYSEVSSYDALLYGGLTVPLDQFHSICTLSPGIPVSPMLAKPTKSIQEVLKRLNGLHFTCEYKYDGERAQIHMLPNGTTKVFSRNLLDTSEKYPEVPIFVKEACHCQDTIGTNNDNTNNETTNTDTSTSDTKFMVSSFVLDAEVVAYNPKTEQFVPFQILSTRKKTEESAETAKVQVIVQAFDLMYLNGQSLLHYTFHERRTMLHQYFHPVANKFQFAHYMDHNENGDTIVLEEFLDHAIKAQCEGLMIKTLDVNAIYEPSRRSLNWLKLKKDYLDGLGDSVDLVPLGAYHGRGKRTGVYGAYLLACYDPDSEEYQSVCKIGTGFSDEDLRTLSEYLNQHTIPTKSSQYNVSDQLECDVWFDTVQVWEVKAADLSKSSTHRGADGKTGEVGRGIGLRFPRFERIRDDKRPDLATTSDQILEMYYQQDSIVDNDRNDDVDDDDGI